MNVRTYFNDLDNRELPTNVQKFLDARRRIVFNKRTSAAFPLMYRIAQRTAKIAYDVVPVETGFLKSTIYFNREGRLITLGFSAPYAPYVHEIITNRHASPTQPKFISDVFKFAMGWLAYFNGEENVPDFYVKFVAHTDEGLYMQFSLEQETPDFMTWRRFLGA